jgi:predicted Ser/Thr protein kinase
MSEFVCRFCSAKLPPYVKNDTCPECGCSIDLIDNNEAADTAALDDATIKPGNFQRSGALANSSDLVGSDFGDYRLLEEIARGGMGVVFRAQQKSLDRFVALKMILEGSLASQVEIDRFKIEAQAAAHLDHPGIVQVYEIGEIDGRHFFSMALVEGESLADKIESGPMDPTQAAELTLKIVEAMDYAHQRGVIHRDLKPANILLDGKGEPKVTDFGLAKRPDRDRDLTMTGQMLGTPSYMAPEQAGGKDITDATDVYALGAILYAMLAGHAPFEGPTIIDTLTKVMEQEPVPLRQENASIPLDLETLCLKCLEKDGGERYESAAELGAELQRFINGEEILARPLSAFGKVMRWRRVIARNKDVRLQSATQIAGFPLVDIAFGRDKDKGEEFGHAKGVIALGDRATGVIAYGGFARGVLAMGMYAIGIVSCGMFAGGVVTAGMIGLGVFANGGLAIGYTSFGFIAIGVWAIGMFSMEWKAMGAFSWGFAKTAYRVIRRIA